MQGVPVSCWRDLPIRRIAASRSPMKKVARRATRYRSPAASTLEPEATGGIIRDSGVTPQGELRLNRVLQDGEEDGKPAELARSVPHQAGGAAVRRRATRLARQGETLIIR